jgi:hypothetical protein
MLRKKDPLQTSATTPEPPMEITRWVFNKKKMDRKKIVSIFISACSQRTLTTNGGFLFKAALIDTEFHISMIPVLLDGERGYHHTIHLAHEDLYTLIGTISTTRELTILFKNNEVSDADRVVYRRVYRILAWLLHIASYENPLQFDWVTLEILTKTHIFTPVPASLAELHAWTC